MKKSYTKPEIKKVALVPEQAVLANCKTSKGGVSGTQGSNCNKPKPCSVLGST